MFRLRSTVFKLKISCGCHFETAGGTLPANQLWLNFVFKKLIKIYLRVRALEINTQINENLFSLYPEKNIVGLQFICSFNNNYSMIPYFHELNILSSSYNSWNTQLDESEKLIGYIGNCYALNKNVEQINTKVMMNS